MKRYALYGPDVPAIDAFADLVWVTESFLALGSGQATVGGEMREKGVTALGMAPPVARFGAALAGVQVQFGDLVVDPQRQSGYINPAYINFLVATGKWEAFKPMFNVTARAPREGKASYQGFEWRIHPKDSNAKSRWQAWQAGFLLTGMDRTAREYSNIIVPQFQIEGLEQQDTIEYDLSADIGPVTVPGPVTEQLINLGVLGVERLPDEKEMSERILREVKGELGVR